MVGGTKVGSRAPVVALTLKRRPGNDLPPADVKEPATYTDVPSAAGSTLSTMPFGFGANAVTSLPVVASNATRCCG